MSEVQSPFRGVRKFLYFGFALAAGIATLFTVPRLIAALQGGENAPDLMDTAGNLGVNVVGESLKEVRVYGSCSRSWLLSYKCYKNVFRVLDCITSVSIPLNVFLLRFLASSFSPA